MKELTNESVMNEWMNEIIYLFIRQWNCEKRNELWMNGWMWMIELIN